jgi:hypothetical protein
MNYKKGKVGLEEGRGWRASGGGGGGGLRNFFIPAQLLCSDRMESWWSAKNAAKWHLSPPPSPTPPLGLGARVLVLQPHSPRTQK